MLVAVPAASLLERNPPRASGKCVAVGLSAHRITAELFDVLRRGSGKLEG